MDIVDKTIALLIDSDNISKKYFSVLMDELNKFGIVTIKKIYGDFTKPKANGWGEALLGFAIEPEQQYACVTGKNSTDSAMIIDAMDILYKGKINCVCLATSDSDFTKLATRFRSDNIVVIGAGTQTAPSSFRAACDRFVLMDVLLAESKEETPPTKPATKQQTEPSHKKQVESQTAPKATDSHIALKRALVVMSKKIIEDEGDSDDSMLIALFMSMLYKKDNSFNPKNYGATSSKVIPFFQSLEVDGKKSFTVTAVKSAERIKINK